MSRQLRPPTQLSSTEVEYRGLVAEGTVEWGTEKHKVELDPFFRHCLLKGQDELAYLMSHRSAIVEHKTQHIHFIQNGART